MVVMSLDLLVPPALPVVADLPWAPGNLPVAAVPALASVAVRWDSLAAQLALFPQAPPQSSASLQPTLVVPVLVPLAAWVLASPATLAWVAPVA